MKKILKFVMPLVLIMSFYTYNADNAFASTSEGVSVSSSTTYNSSNSVNASSKVFILLKNYGSVDIIWQIHNANGALDSDTYTIRPGEAVGKWVNTNSNTKHKLALYCTGDTNKCSGTGNISLN
ncbi:hypothetical protein FOH38_14410 [Lysinibacillus fusiformis]|nr:hypothetical protein FOH38_14410 [Lysinibacillus fusiformis]